MNLRRASFRGEQHASPSEAPRGMKMKLTRKMLQIAALIRSFVVFQTMPPSVNRDSLPSSEIVVSTTRNRDAVHREV